MQTLLSYSLQDFLLFSKDTWLVLYNEYLTAWWWLSLLVSICIAINILWQSSRRTEFWMMLLTHLLILFSCLCYYSLFYRQINGYANFFTVLVVIQICLLLVLTGIKLCAGSQQNTAFKRGLFHRYSVDAWHKRLLYLGAVLLVFLSIELYFFEHSKVVMLPGAHPLISLLALLYLAKHQRQFPAIYYIAPTVLLIVEILTLYVLELSFWWGYLMVMLLAFLFPGRTR